MPVHCRSLDSAKIFCNRKNSFPGTCNFFICLLSHETHILTLEIIATSWLKDATAHISCTMNSYKWHVLLTVVYIYIFDI
ncbi:hypothetical protein Zm00014a_029296 [Zea mays]|uniref:Uncharacterized protein n=1 Tax=Zea mays TaxID=4577 RepID=A0A3L6E9H3_MAIZE|nr:hypothetical protein Zm00014a_029296 [Zea mays]